MDHQGRVTQDEYHAALDRRDKRISDLQAENATFRAALKRIADGEIDLGGNRRSHPFSMAIARDALGLDVR